jgi:hypothetical protein
MGNASSKHKHNKRSIGSRKIVAATSPVQYKKQETAVANDHQENIYVDDTYTEHIRTENIHTNIDSCIERLIQAGTSDHIGKTACITQPEMIAICRYAYDLFLSQPVNIIFLYRYMPRDNIFNRRYLN